MTDALPLVEIGFERNLMVDYSRERAEVILYDYIDVVTSKFEEHILSIILVGSLANNSYIEGPGRDIDQITILKAGTSDVVFKEVLETIRRINCSNHNELLLAESIYHLHELSKPYEKDFELRKSNKRLLEVPVELLRIFESGKVVYGEHQIIDLLEKPNKSDVVFFNNLSRKWKSTSGIKISETMDAIEGLTPRIEVQIVLTLAMTHYYYATKVSCSNKHEIGNRMKDDVSTYAFQEVLDLATEIKMNMKTQYSINVLNQLRVGCKSMLEWHSNHPEGTVP